MSTHGTSPRERHAAQEATSRDTHTSGGFDPTVGGMPMSIARDGEQTQLPDLAPESVDGTIIAPGAVDGGVHIIPETLSLDLFAETIRPPSIVDVLPVLPDDSYVEGQLAFLTTNGKLYRNVANTWTAEVDGGDIVAGSILAGTLAVGAVGADEIAAGAITTEKFHVGAKAPGVNNNPTDPGNAEVLIDGDGITILNGKINLLDYAGSSVLNASGFGGSWTNFVRSGIYNSDFGASVVGNLVLSEVAGGTPTANYVDSISDLIPYWVVETVGATPPAIVADAAAPGGKVINIRASTRVYQDIPVVPGIEYGVRLSRNLQAGPFGTHIEIEYELEWFDVNHVYIGAAGFENDYYESYSTAAYKDILCLAGEAPANARYLRFRIRGISGSTVASFYRVGSVHLVEAAPAFESLKLAPSLYLDSDEWVLPSYAAITIEPTSTGLNIARMNPAGKIGLFLETEAVADTVFSAKLATEASARFTIAGDGSMEWGAGSGIRDIGLKRLSANILETTAPAGGSGVIQAKASTAAGSAFRGIVSGDSDWRWRLAGDGTIHWGTGNGAADVTLARTAANVLAIGASDRWDFEAIGRELVKTTATSIPHSTWTKIGTFNSTPYSNTVEGTVTYGGNLPESSLVLNCDGWYEVFGQVEWAANATGGRILGYTVATGGTPGTTAGAGLRVAQLGMSQAGVGAAQHFSFKRYMLAGDRVSMVAWQNSGAALDILANCRFGVRRLGS